MLDFFESEEEEEEAAGVKERLFFVVSSDFPPMLLPAKVGENDTFLGPGVFRPPRELKLE